MERRSGTRRTVSLREMRLPSADAFPTVLRYSIYTPCTLTLSLPLSALAEAGVGDSVPAVGDGAEVGAGKFPVEGAMVPKAPSKFLCGGGRSVWVCVVFRPLEVRRHLVNAPHEVRQ